MRNRKKNIFIIVALALLVVIGNACSKWLTVVPDDGIYSQSYWKDRNDLEGALGGCYSAFSRCTDKIFLLSEIRNDMVVKGISILDAQQRLKEGRIANDNTYVNWNEFYYTINLCNTVIKNGPKILVSDMTVTPNEVKASLAEAYFLRSLAYFYLVRFFKEVPLITEPYEDNTKTFNVAKSNEQVIVNQIISDLEANVSYATPDYTTSTLVNALTPEDLNRAYYNFGRVTRYAYWALMADVYLWNGQNQKCSDVCDSIIQSNRYRLLDDMYVQAHKYGSATLTTTWYQNFYTSINFDEHIFTTLYLANTGGNKVARFVSLAGDNNLLGNSPLLDELFVDHNDVRGLGASYATGGTIWKWAGVAERNSILMRDLNSVSDFRYPHWIIYRLADVLLMKAEAVGELGDFAASNDLINKVRSRAGAVEYEDAASDVSSNEDRVLLERQLELAYEGKRWFDLIRNGKRNNGARMSLVTEAVMKSADLQSSGLVLTSVSDTMGWYYPIYYDELNKNKSLVQNPFYLH